MSQLIGARVVRGPNWKWQSQDGGEGHVGTIASLKNDGNDDSATVVWDCGVKASYKLPELRILDNAACGVKHANIICDECKEQGIIGMRWKCSVCHNYDLCTTCYMSDKHDVTHAFKRFTTPQCEPVMLPPRKNSVTIGATGIFAGAVVVRGPDWKWNDQDGGFGETGKVVKVTDWSAPSFRSAVSVNWNSSNRNNNYRLGHDGKVDLLYKTSSSGGKYYCEHLPIAEQIKQQESNNQAPELKLGDRVKTAFPIDAIKALQQGHGGWIPEMSTIIGEAGTVIGFSELGNVQVQYDTKKYWLNPAALTKITSINPGDVVFIINDAAKVKELQIGHGGWIDAMQSVIGKAGKVTRVETNGCLRVQVGTHEWAFNPACCILATKERPSIAADDKSDSDPNSDEVLEILRGAMALSLAASTITVRSGVFSALEVSLAEANQTAPKFKENDIVRIIGDVHKAKELQQNHGGWNDLMKLSPGWSAFVNELVRNGCHRRFPVKLKCKIYTTVVTPALTYDAETLAISKKNEKRLKVKAMKMLNWSCCSNGNDSVKIASKILTRKRMVRNSNHVAEAQTGAFL